MPLARKIQPPAPRSSSRAIALAALEAILNKGQNLAEALQKRPGIDKLEARDRAFARLLLLTTLRRLGQIDNIIDGNLEKPLPAKRATVRHILRLGAAQLLFLDTPAHAAVDGAVALTNSSRHAPLKGLVNALLRRIAREGRARCNAQDAARLNTSDLLWQSWINCYGEKICRAIAKVQMSEPPTDLSVKKELESWAVRLNAKRLPSGTLRLKRAGAVEMLAGYDTGAWWVQDWAASLPAKLFGDVIGKNIIEIGAAPGGKTAQLAAAGATVQAIDRSPMRIKRLQQNLARLSLTAEIVEADGENWRPAELAEGLLLDAPCSATGTIRRHPEIMWRRTPEDIVASTKRQTRLLSAASDMIKPGGLLVYTVCSLQPEEGPAQVEKFLSSDGRFERVAITSEEIGGLADALTPSGDLRTLPCHWAPLGGMDGFFAARLRRTF